MELQNKMKRILVIGCPGAGKSTFARRLSAKTRIPLHYLDMIWHRPDKTTVGREAFVEELNKIIKGDAWIIDGTYFHTLPLRLEHCDTVVLFDIPLELCLEGACHRIGKPREDMPWIETELDQKFYQWIVDFPKMQMPAINDLLSSYSQKLNIIRLKSREEADAFIDSLGAM